MKKLTQKTALQRLRNLKDSFRKRISEKFEYKAKDCLTCDVQGICCTDAHFVNVHITRLEALAIKNTIGKLTKTQQETIYKRNKETIEKHELAEDCGSFEKKFSCPLFEKGIGCLVHKEAKPATCIQHACYENEEDLPPDELQIAQEKNIERLNSQTFGNAWNWLPLPIWLEKIRDE